MKIFINDIDLDFDLENERDLGQVLQSLQKWLEREGHHIQSILVDQESLDWDRPEDWESKPVERIGKIEIASVNSLELKVQYLHALHQFFTLLRRSLEEKNLLLLRQVVKEYAGIKTYLGLVFAGGEASPEDGGAAGLAGRVDGFLQDSGILDPSGEADFPDRAAEVIPLISALELLLAELIREMTNPLQETLSTVALIRELIPQLAEVSILLQTGKDKDAMDRVIRFTECSQKILRIYPHLKAQGLLDTQKARVDNLKFDEYYKDLNRILLELTQSFAAGDSVLIGDLLEYEVAPRLETLSNFLDTLNESG
ncbi:MAG: hypothetical protein LBQ61_09080 [Spirochaetales bacterium]|jgi:hypothetical protein|nr:hypothetical protein [Spirochaetales bacterium]